MQIHNISPLLLLLLLLLICLAASAQSNEEQLNSTVSSSADSSSSSSTCNPEQPLSCSDQQQTNEKETSETTATASLKNLNTCGLYLAPSTLDSPHAGLGLFAGTDIPEGGFVSGDSLKSQQSELLVAIQDVYKTLPYRGQHRFLSWLGYIWPSQVDVFWHMTRASFPMIPPSHYQVQEGLNAAVNDDEALVFYHLESLERMNAFVPGIASLANSHPQAANIDRDPFSHTTDEPTSNAAYTPHYAIQFTATQNIPAGSELFLHYGELWHNRYNEKNADGYKQFDTTPQEYMTPDKNITIPTEADKRAKWPGMEAVLQRRLLDQFRNDLKQEARLRTAQRTHSNHNVQGLIDTTTSQNATHAIEQMTTTSTTKTLATTVTENYNNNKNLDQSETMVETEITVKTTTTTVTPLGELSDEEEDEEEEEDDTTTGGNEEDDDDDRGEHDKPILLAVGTQVYEEFDGEWFWGEVKDYDEEENTYTIIFTDNETEEYHGQDDLAQLQAMLDAAKDETRKVIRQQRQQAQARRRTAAAEIDDEQEHSQPQPKPMEWLQTNGVCMDHLQTGNSTIEKAGRGAFAKHFMAQGSLIAPAPLMILKRDDLAMYEFDPTTSIKREALHQDKVVGQELLLNYCYGHPDSDLLLLPYAPGVNFINHNHNKQPNARIQWPTASSPLAASALAFMVQETQTWLDRHPLEVLEQSGKLMMEYIAIRDIQPGDEITIDYGSAWEEAWTNHEQSTTTTTTNSNKTAFRHEIGVPDSFFPETWKHQKTIYELIDQNGPLEAGEMDELRWAHNGERVSEGLLRVGLPKGFSAKIREYAEERSITGLYDRLIADTYLENDHWHVIESINDEQWFAHRYENKEWRFDMHYVSAWDENARQSFFRTLGQAGFDAVLDGIGNYFGYDNMTCFHFSFMGLSEADNSFTHADLYATGKKGFNLIFPLITVDGAKPELDIISENANIEVSVKYLDDVAYLLGDWGYHKTSAADNHGQLRLVVSLYCGQLDETNAEMMAHIYDGEDPAPFMSQFDLPIKEYHWGNGHTLPK